MSAARSIVRIAVRNLSRQRTRSAILLTALASFIGLSVVLDAFASGFYGAMTDLAVGQTLGEVQAHAPGHLPARQLDATLNAAEATCAAEQPGVRVVASRVRVNGMASTPGGARPVDVLGGDAMAELRFGSMLDPLTEGRPLSDRGADRLAAVVGRGLAEALWLSLGDAVELSVVDTTGAPARAVFEVVGIFPADASTQAGRVVFVQPRTLSALLRLPDGVVTEVALRTDRDARPQDVRDRIAAACPGAGVVQTWAQRAPSLSAAMTTDHNFLRATYALFVLIAGIMVLNLQLMSVLERTRELGMLLALGATPRKLMAMLTLEASLLGTLGVALGLGLGLLGAAAMSGGVDVRGMTADAGTVGGVALVPIVYPIVDLQLVGFLCGGMVLATIAAAVGPALRLRSLDPVTAMQGEKREER